MVGRAAVIIGYKKRSCGLEEGKPQCDALRLSEGGRELGQRKEQEKKEENRENDRMPRPAKLTSIANSLELLCRREWRRGEASSRRNQVGECSFMKTTSSWYPSGADLSLPTERFRSSGYRRAED